MGRSDTARQLPLPNVISEALDTRGLTPFRDHRQTLPPGVLIAAPYRSAQPVVSPTDLDRVHLERRLVVAVGAPLTLTLTDNRRTMLSIRRREGVRRVRLHWMFVDAPPAVIDAVGRYLAHEDSRACRRIDQYIAANRVRIRSPRVSLTYPEATRGAVHDLVALRDTLAARYFDGPVHVAIGWGRSATGLRRRPHRRIIRMGTYYLDERLIRIHPALDREWVPEYFVAWVIYHEMLHHVVPIPAVNGRRCYHTPEFRARECLFVEGDRAREWERANLHRLIASRDA